MLLENRPFSVAELMANFNLVLNSGELLYYNIAFTITHMEIKFSKHFKENQIKFLLVIKSHNKTFLICLICVKTLF
jgi:hypothetical protein